jgi:hypothetical protein
MTANDLTANWREVYEERAAIMEYDGGMTRERAEEQALRDTLNEMRRAGWRATASSVASSP